MQTTSTDGVTIAFDDQGSGSTAVVFIHGWCCNRGHWRGQVEHFGRAHRVVTVDLAGHGESGRDRQEWSIKAFGRDVACVLDAAGVDSAVLVGHSLGGPVAVEAALAWNGTTLGIVGVDSLFDFYANPVDGEGFKKDFDTKMKETAAGMFNTDAHPEQRPFAEAMAASPMEVAVPVRVGLAAWGQEDYPTSMERLTVPLRMIQYKRDEDVTGRLRELAEHLPSFGVVEVADVGHFVMLDDPDRFNLKLEKCLAEFVG